MQRLFQAVADRFGQAALGIVAAEFPEERAAQVLGLDLIKPAKGAPEILGFHYSNGFGKCVIDAPTWAEARTQITKFSAQRAAA